MPNLKDIQYGNHSRQCYDLLFPKKPNINPHLFVLIHGGGWVAGHKKMLNSLAAFLNDQGHYVTNIHYRLLHQVESIDDQMEDIVSALAHVKTTKQADFNYNKIIAIGESAGAHLTLLTYEKAKWDAIISLSGPLNYVQVEKKDFPFSTQRWFLPYLLKNQDKNESNWRKISPLYQEVNCPILIFQGKKDKLVDYHDAVSFNEKLKKAKVPSKLILKEEWGHLYRVIDKKSQRFVYLTIIKWVDELSML